MHVHIYRYVNIQVMKKELIIKAMLLSYPCTVRINKQLLAACNFSEFEAIR